MSIARFPCTLCGSRNWPRENTSCPLCSLEDDDDIDEETETEIVSKIPLDQEHGSRLYDVFVHFMHMQFGGPKMQRTPTTESAQRIADHMQDKDAEQLCYELCREYLSNAKQPTPCTTPC